MNHRIGKIVVGIGLTLAGTLTLTACLSTRAETSKPALSGNGSELPTVVPTGCKVAPPAITSSTPTVAILSQTGPGIDYYQPDLATVLADATTSKARVLVNGIGKSSTAPDRAADYVLTADGPNPAFRKRNLACKTALVATAVTQRLAGVAGVAHPDVFSALNTLAGNLKGNPSTQPVDVVLFTVLSGNGGGVDLSNPKTLAHPKVAINKLAAEGLIQSCKNERFYGVGADRGLTDTESARLQEFWRSYTEKCGGQLVAWTGHLTQFPVIGALQPPDTSQIKIVTTPTKATATLGGDVLFSPGSPTLRSTAARELGQLLAQVNKYGGKVVVTGYTDVGGNEAANVRLSVARAAGVTSWLLSHGVSEKRLTANGDGSRDAIYKEPRTSAQHQANRRVVAVIYFR